MNRFVTAAFASILLAGGALATSADSAIVAADGMLTNAEGMTLYTFDKDTEGVSNCADECVAKWPVLSATAKDTAEGDYTVIDRADGARQWAYKGKPLYTFVGDTAVGEVKGDGVKDVWHIARP